MLPKLRTNFDLSFRICREKSRARMEKKKGILLSRNYFNFPLVKVIVSKIAYKSRWKTKNEHFLTKNFRKVVLEFFSGTSGISYCSKTCSSRPGISIAPTPDRFGHVQAIKDTIEKIGSWRSFRSPPKKTHIFKTLWTWFEHLVKKQNV